MAVIDGGTTGTLMEVGLGTAAPGHVTSKPSPVSVGQFQMAVGTATLAAALAANAQLFYIRNTDATRTIVIHRLRAQFQALTPFTAATLTDFGFDLIKATSVSAGGGGTDVLTVALPPTRMNPAHGASILVTGSCRIATTGALTALTTLDSYPIFASLGDTQRVNPVAATEEVIVNNPNLEYWPDVGRGEHPIMLGQNEALILRNRTVWPAAGTGLLRVSMSWSETTVY